MDILPASSNIKYDHILKAGKSKIIFKNYLNFSCILTVFFYSPNFYQIFPTFLPIQIHIISSSIKKFNKKSKIKNNENQNKLKIIKENQ